MPLFRKKASGASIIIVRLPQLLAGEQLTLLSTAYERDIPGGGFPQLIILTA